PGANPARLSSPGHLLGRRPPALRPLRRDDPRRFLGLLLLVPADVETDVQRAPGPVALRLHDDRLQRRLLHDALPRPGGDAPPHLRLQSVLRPAVPLDLELARDARSVRPGIRPGLLP